MIVQISDCDYQSSLLTTGVIVGQLVFLTAPSVREISIDGILCLVKNFRESIFEVEVLVSDFEIRKFGDSGNHHIQICAVDLDLRVSAL